MPRCYWPFQPPRAELFQSAGVEVATTGGQLAAVGLRPVHYTGDGADTSRELPSSLFSPLLLLEQPGHLYTREEITESVWHHRYIATSRTLDVHMRRLRDKLKQVDAGFTIQAVRGVGYRLAPARGSQTAAREPAA